MDAKLCLMVRLPAPVALCVVVAAVGCGGKSSNGPATAHDGAADAFAADVADSGASDSAPSRCQVARYDLGARAQGPPFVAWTGSDLLAFWIDATDFAGHGVRRGADGAAAGTDWTAPFHLAFAHAGLAWAGTELGVLYQNADIPSADLYFTSVGGDGATVVAPQRIADTPGSTESELLAWNGINYGAAWRGAGTPQTPLFAEITPAGAVTTARADPIGIGDQVQVAPAAQGGWWWANIDARGESDVGVAHVAAGGAVAASQTTHSTQVLVSPWLASADTGTFLVYGDDFDDRIHLRSVDPATAALGADHLVSSNVFAPTIAIAWGAGRLGMAWYALDQGPGKTTVSFVELDQIGNPLGAPVAISAPDEGALVGEGLVNPSWLAWTGERWALAWLAHREANDLMLSVVSCP
jgi:hypothetical protein